MIIKVKKMYKDAKLPTLSYEEPLGIDLYLYKAEKVYEGEYQGSIWKAYTGIAIELPEGFGAFIKDRSSIALKYGWFTKAGVIDNDYRGEWIVVFESPFHKEFPFKKDEKIAQFVLQKKYYIDEIIEIKELSETARGNKGFGSSNK